MMRDVLEVRNILKIYMLLVLWLIPNGINQADDGLEPVMWLPINAYHAVWSPVEGLIAASNYEALPTGEQIIRLYRVDPARQTVDELVPIVFSDDPDEAISLLSWSPDGGLLVAMSSQNYRIYERETFNLLYEIPSKWVPFISWSPDSTQFIVPVGRVISSGNSVRYWVDQFNIHHAKTGEIVDFIHVRNTESLSQVARYSVFHVRSMAWSALPPNRVVFIGVPDIGFMVNLDESDIREATPAFSCCLDNLWTVKWQPNGEYVATQTYVYDMVSERVVFEYPDDYHAIFEWHPSGDWLVGSFASSVSLIDIKNQSTVGQFETASIIYGFSWSDDGRYLATVNSNSDVAIWDMQGLMAR